MKTLKVELGERSYPIYVSRGIISVIGKIFKDLGCSQKCLMITDKTVGGLYGGMVQSSLTECGFFIHTVIIEDGEASKSLSVAEKIYGKALGCGLDRNSIIVALGGGVVGDLAGFIASTYMRGIPYVQVPTSLLAQVDSSVGGKVAVNYQQVKNLIGAFYQPAAVLIDPMALDSLPAREFKSGMAEVIKYGAIWDPGLFAVLEKQVHDVLNLDPDIIENMVLRSCEIKAEVVSADEREKGLRSILNFGHSFGHAVEVLGGLNILKHGESVAVGMCMAARTAHLMGSLSKEDADRIVSIVASYGLPTRPPFEINPNSLQEIMLKDKKNRGKKTALVLPEMIGKVNLVFFSQEELEPLLRSVCLL